MEVVIIGAGYAGLRAVEKLVKTEGIHITLIDLNPYHYMQTEVYGYMAGKYDIHDITVNLQNWCNGFETPIHFIHEEAININPHKQTVQTKTQAIPYDELIIATGAKTNFPSFIDGLENNTYGVKVLDRAFELKTKFEHIIYQIIRNGNNQEFNIVIGGAGLSGVEIAAEMAYISKKFTKSSGIKESNIKIHLVEAYDSILYGMDPYVISVSNKRLKKLGINIMTNSFIQKVHENSFELENGQSIAFDFMIFTGGIKATGINEVLDVPKNKINQFIVDSYLRVNGYLNIYAVGDCAEIKDVHGNILPPTAQIAEQCAESVALNIIHKKNGNTPEIYRGHIDGMFIALGGNYAVGTIFNKIKVKGYVAFILKKFITKSYHYGLIFRFNNGYKLRG